MTSHETPLSLYNNFVILTNLMFMTHFYNTSTEIGLICQRDHPAQFQSGRPWASKLTRVRLWMPRMDPLETSKPIRGCSGPDSDLWESLACGARRKAEYPFAWRVYLIVLR